MKRALLVMLIATLAGCATPAADPAERSRQNAEKQEMLRHLNDIEMQQRG